MKIHHGWTFWFQSKKTNKSYANVNPIIIRLFVILQMWIIMEENLILVPLFDLKNLVGLLDAPNAKPFTN